MRILFSGNTAWSMYNFRRNIFESFINNGIDVIVVAPEDNNFSKKLITIGCKFIHIDINRKGTNPINDLKLLIQYKNILKKEKPCGCFFYTIKPNIYGGIAATYCKIPYITITTGLGYIFNNNNIVSYIAKLLYKISFKKAKSVWFLNNDDINSFIEEKIIPKSKTHLLKGEGIDTAHFKIEFKDNENFSFILIARLLWDKGVGLYVEAAKIIRKRYPNITFKLLGPIDKNNPMGINEETINQWNQEGIINYLGEVEDVRPYINDSSCIVLPSYYREGIPFCLMEAASSGKPIITTDNIGCKEVIIDGYNGFICKTNNLESLISSMEKMILLPISQRRNMGLNGRKFMENEFDIKYIIKDYYNALRMF